MDDVVADPYVGSVPGILAPGEGEPDPEGAKVVEEEEHTHGIKLGWIQGVLIPCLLNIWGVMLFLRLSWVVAQAGIGQTLLIIAISAVVCVLTTLSLSAISTNGEVKGGGIYYIISRCLGPEFGASIGVVFAFANAVAASMNTIGFCNSLNDLLKEHDIKIIDGANNDVRLVGCIAIVVMIIICAVGMEWESKAQNLLIVIIIGAIIDFIAGCCVGPKGDPEKISKGFLGLDLEVFQKNWAADYRFSENVDQTFFSVFSIFFPSVTGIQAGANISGDLKDPAGAIPKGTMLALLLSMISYALFVVFAGGAAVRDASGIPGQVLNNTFMDCRLNNTCDYGLMNSYTMMQTISLWGPFIYAGCFAATLSTALTNLLSVPRLIQALGKDRIYPGLIYFSKGYGKAGEPYRGYVLTLIISCAFLLIAELNLIAPLISNFYLASYALINFCTFHAALIKPVGWRPTFKYYNMWLSLCGFILCVAIMFLIDWITSLVTFIIIFALYLIVVYRKPDVNWGSSTQAQNYKTAIQAALRLTRVSEHVKNYRPQVLVLSGFPQDRPTLIRLTHQLTKSQGLLLAAEWHEIKLAYRMKSARIKAASAWFHQQHIRGFFTIIDGCGFEQCANALMQASGLGKLKPNVLLMGYKRNWQSCNSQELLAYFNILHDAFDNRIAVAILRLQEGLDFSDKQENSVNMVAKVSVSNLPKPTIIAEGGLMHADSDLNIGTIGRMESQESLPDFDVNSTVTASNTNTFNINSHTIFSKNSSHSVDEKSNEDFFHRKHKNETIDVWWLYDDGGLTILLPYLIINRHNWTGCKLRIFALANRKQELELEERNMANLLSKFRIEYTSLKLVTGITEKPTEETNNLFKNIVEKFREESYINPDAMITDNELDILQEKTNRHLRLREMLMENSTKAGLVIMSLPMPRKGMVSAALYMAWLEVLSKDMPPFLFIRGNHTSVLTFYS